jgi:hypothetical protein
MEDHDQQSVGDTLSVMIQDVGVMPKSHTDNAPEMVGRKTPFLKKARKEGIDLTSIEPERPNENYGEIIVRKAKSLTSSIMHRKNVPLRLWCYAMEYACELESLKVPGMYRNKGRSGYELVFGTTPDISEYVEFEFYDYCWYWDSPQSFPHEKKSLGRWLGVAHRVGQAMVCYIMNTNGKVIARSTAVPLDPHDVSVQETKVRISALDDVIKASLGDYRNASEDKAKDIPDISDDDLLGQLRYTFGLEDEDLDPSKLDIAGDEHRPDYDAAPSRDVDKFLGVYVEIPSHDGEGKILARVKDRKRNHDGQLIGETHENPILSTAIYNVESPDGRIAKYSANVIADNLYSTVDDDGYGSITTMMKEDTAVCKANGFVASKSNAKKHITTKGWHLKVQWENGE